MTPIGSLCPQCGELLRTYYPDAGRYVGCPECLWMGEIEPYDGDTFGVSFPEESDDDPIADWILGDLDGPTIP